VTAAVSLSWRSNLNCITDEIIGTDQLEGLNSTMSGWWCNVPISEK
jgi:hypothetical protein